MGGPLRAIWLGLLLAMPAQAEPPGNAFRKTYIEASSTNGADDLAPGSNGSPLKGEYLVRSRGRQTGQEVLEVKISETETRFISADAAPEFTSGGRRGREEEVRYRRQDNEPKAGGQQNSCANINVDAPRLPRPHTRPVPEAEPATSTPAVTPPTPVDPGTPTAQTPETPPAPLPPAVETGSMIPPPDATSYPPASTSPVFLAELADQVAVTADTVATIAEEDERQDFFSAVLDARRVVREAARGDQEVLSAPYRKLSVEGLAPYLERSAKALAENAARLSQVEDGIPPSELVRFRNLYLNARDKAEFGAATIRDEQERIRRLGENTPFMGLLGPRQGLAKTESLRDIFGNEDGNAESAAARASSNDGLMNRLVMYNGLLEKERDKLLQRLKLAEKTTVRLADGTQATIPLLHNGYIFGGGATAMDCSSFVSSTLPPEVRKGRFTTLDFRQMWIYRRTGEFPLPPAYRPPRAKLVRQTAEAFNALNVYEGERLITGDLLVYRLPWETAGHVFIVRSFDPRTLKVEVIEAAQSAGTIRERDFPLSLDPMDAKKRTLRPGLFGLRIRPVNNRVCTASRGVAAAPGRPISGPRRGGGAAR